MTIHTSRSLRSPIRKHRNLEDDQKNQKRSRTLPLLCYSPNDEILALRGGALPPKGSRRAKSKRVQPPRAAKGGKTNQKSGRSQDQSSAPKVVDSTTGPSLAGTVGATQSVNRTHAGGDAKDPRPPVVPAAATSPNTKRKEPPTPLPGIPVNNPAPESSIPFQPLLSARKTHTSNNRDVSGSTWLKTGRTTQAASNERVPVVAIDPGNRENHDDEIQQPQTPPHLFEEDDLYNSTPPSSPTLNRNLFHAAAQAKRNDDGGGDTSPSFSGRPFTEDDEILRHWARLGRIVAHFVDTVLVDRLPEEAITNASFPFKALEPLSSLAADMCRSPRYAKYLFQIGIWNILDRIFFTTLSTAWACEEFGVSPHTQTYGQAETLGRLTWDFGVQNHPRRSCDVHSRFFRWRKQTVDFLYDNVLGDDDYERQVEKISHTILFTFLGCFNPEYNQGSAQAWDQLVNSANLVVAEAGNLAIKMRRAADGVWEPFIPTPGSAALEAAVRVHRQKEFALPPDQTGIQDGSVVVMTVVPGLAKFIMESDPASAGAQDQVPRIRTRVRMMARCFIDLDSGNVTGST